MENLGKRTTLILVAVFLLATVGWYFSIKTCGDTAPAHCAYQAAKVTCTPA
jgi:hypothetical protein